MKIIIINAFKQRSQGMRKFKNFVQCVKAAFKKHQYTWPGNLEFVLRDISNIDEFLFESHAVGTNDSK